MASDCSASAVRLHARETNKKVTEVDYVTFTGDDTNNTILNLHISKQTQILQRRQRQSEKYKEA
jgi:hypothetical protein